MDTNTDRAALIASLRSWGKDRRALEVKRDPLVRAALEAGISIEVIHKLTDLGRSTIDRIRKEGGDER